MQTPAVRGVLRQEVEAEADQRLVGHAVRPQQLELACGRKCSVRTGLEIVEMEFFLCLVSADRWRKNQKSSIQPWWAELTKR